MHASAELYPLSLPVSSVMQAWVIHWYQGLSQTPGQAQLYGLLSADISPLFGGLWVHMAAGDVQHVTIHVQTVIKPLALEDVATLKEGGQPGAPGSFAPAIKCVLMLQVQNCLQSAAKQH